MIVYISIGNSDDKLTQREWADFVKLVDGIFAHTLWDTKNGNAIRLHGRWLSVPDAPWQNACWCVEFDPDHSFMTPDGNTTTLGADLRYRLTGAARFFGQDSIAWAHAPVTEFLAPGQGGAA